MCEMSERLTDERVKWLRERERERGDEEVRQAWRKRRGNRGEARTGKERRENSEG